MPNPKTKLYTKALKETMRRKSEILSKAQAFWEIGMKETAQPLWLSGPLREDTRELVYARFRRNNSR